MNKCLEILKNLGSTPEEIRKEIQLTGIRGVKGTHFHNPLARYLVGKGYDVGVSYDQDGLVFIWSGTTLDHEHTMAPVVKEFLEMFDAGKYPELVAIT